MSPAPQARASLVPPRRLALAAGAVAITVVLLGLPALGFFGPTWDLVFGSYGFGHQDLAYALGGDAADMLNPPLGRMPAMRSPHPDFETVGRFDRPIVYPLGGLLSAVSCELLWTRAGILPAMAAHHLPALLCFAALMATLVLVGGRRIGAWGAAGAVLAALCAPRLVAHGLHNLKDTVEMVFYTWSFLLAMRALKSGSAWHWLGAGVLMGLALAQKANVLFVPVQVALMWLVLVVLARRAGRPAPRLPWVGALIVLLAAPLTRLAVCPWMWSDTWTRLGAHIDFIFRVGTARVGGSGDALRALRTVLQTTPLPLLALAALGVFSRRLSGETRALLLVGVGVPLARTMLPLREAGGIRQFMEFMPFLCLAAGAAVQWLADGLAARIAAPRRAAGATAALCLALFAGPAWAVASTFPYGAVYYNALRGGLSGARASGRPDSTDNWCDSYWHGLDWLSKHAEPNATLMVPFGWHVAAAAAPVRLRGDIRLLRDETDPGPIDVPLYVMSTTPVAGCVPVRRWLARHLTPLHEVTVQGASILQIYRLDGADDARLALDIWRRWERLSPGLAAWLEREPSGMANDVAALNALAVVDQLAWFSARLAQQGDPAWAPLARELAALDALRQRAPTGH